MLHIVKHYYALSDAIAYSKEGDAFLLVEDAVYAALPEHKTNELLNDLASVYVLLEDQKARGTTNNSTTQQVNFSGFVELTERFPTSITWE